VELSEKSIKTSSACQGNPYKEVRMRTRITIIISLLFTFFLIPNISAEKDKKNSKSAITHNQKVCPVTGKKIKSKYFTDIQGQRVYHSNDTCSAVFLKDPEKYFKIIEENMIFLENLQTVCPITGKEMEKNSFIYYKGHRLYLCCKECRVVFDKDRGAYLELLDKQIKSKKSKSTQK
jgi:YHS domain-containing protein